MSKKDMVTRANRLFIMIILGTFTFAELLYLAPEYRWGLDQAFVLVATIFK